MNKDNKNRDKLKITEEALEMTDQRLLDEACSHRFEKHGSIAATLASAACLVLAAAAAIFLLKPKTERGQSAVTPSDTVKNSAQPTAEVQTPHIDPTPETEQPTVEPTEQPTAVPTPTPDPAAYVSPEFAAMRLDKLEYGKDYVSLYERVGKGVSIADVTEDKTTGLAYLSVSGEMRELGLDFLSRAMVENIEPTDEFQTEDEVYAEWWRLYIQRWNHLLPEIPLYRNEYYCLYNTEIKGVKEYPVNPYFDQSRAVLYWSSDKDDNSIILGVTNDPNGAFRFPGSLASSAGYFDYNAFTLTTGDGIVAKTRDGGYAFNSSLVKSHERTTDDKGNPVYTIVLHDDLKFSDGSSIGAKDFLAMQMVTLSDVFSFANGNRPDGRAILGWKDEYRNYDGSGSGKVLRGLRLLSENSFSVTLDKAEVSRFYEIAALEGFVAQYADAWLNGFEILDDGEGCYLSDGFYKKTNDVYDMQEHLSALCSDYSTEMLSRYPWAGPYKPISVTEPEPRGYISPDDETITLHLERNEYYMGNYEGVKPSIEKIKFRKCVSAWLIEDLRDKKLDFYPGITGGAETDEALRVCENSNGELDYTHFYRAGYGKIQFRGDLGPVQFAEVRRALAYCYDRVKYADDFTGGYGVPATAPFSEESWMYKLAAENGLMINDYLAGSDDDPGKWNVKAAAKKVEELLVAGGWIYNERGEPYSEGIRYKRIPGDVIGEADRNYASAEGDYRTVEIDGDWYMPLVLNNAYPVDGIWIEPYNLEVFERAGGKVYWSYTDFADMLSEMYQDDTLYGPGYYSGTPTYNMFNFATSFAYASFDRSTAHTIDPDMYRDFTLYYFKDYADIFFID